MDGKQKKMISAVVIVALVVAGIAGYFLWYKKTPEYSLGILKTAAEQHDWDTFSQHFDSNQVYNSAYEDLMAQIMDNQEMDDTVKGLATGFIQALKPTVVSALTDATRRWVETGNFENEQPQVQQGQKDQPQINAKAITKNTGLNNSEIKGVEYTKRDGKIAAVGIKVYDKDLGKDFVIDIKMSELDDRTWKVIGVSNLKDYLNAIKEARQAKLDALNAPIKQEIDTVVSCQTVKATVSRANRWSFSPTLTLIMPVVFNSQKPIAELTGEIMSSLSNGKVVKIPLTLTVENVTQGNQEFTASKDLNPFMANEKALATDTNAKYEVTITGIKYSDGSKTELYKELPKE